jgi:Histidine kinase
MENAKHHVPLSWNHSPLIPLTALWTTLWMLVSLIEFPAYLHDPAIPLWKPIVLAAVPTCTIILWLIFELRSARYRNLPLEPSRPWFLYHLRRLPLLITGYIVIVVSVRHGLFALAGEQFEGPTRIPFQLLKCVLFYSLWLGLVYGTLSLIHLREKSAQLGLIQKALIESQLAQLQAQLRPHFLFNTLNTVSSLMQSDVLRADRVLARLGDLLRASLGAGKTSSVPLREDLRLLRLYAEIMQERFSGRVLMDWQIAEDALSAQVPAMLLQPLLENAFKYGIEKTTGFERIRVVATCDQGQLRIKIHNSGSVLRRGWHEGVGIANCRERLQVLYGNAGTVDIANATDAGVEASIALPLNSANV